MKSLTLLTSLIITSSIATSPVAMAKGGNHHGAKYAKGALSHQYQKDKTTTQEQRQIKKQKKLIKKAQQRGASVYAKEDNKHLPPGLEMNAVRGKALPVGWTKDGRIRGLNADNYAIITQDGKRYAILNKDVLDAATVISRPRAGVVQVKIDDRTIEVLEATRAIMNIIK